MLLLFKEITMFENITRADFSIDTVFPAVQTFTALLAAEALGRLGHYKVSAQSTVLIAGIASLLSALANKFFENKIYQALAVPVSVAGGLLAHRFFYPGRELSAIANVQEIVIISAILLSVKLLADNWNRLKGAAEEVEKEVKEVAQDLKDGAKKVAGAGLDVADEVLQEADAGVKDLEDKVTPKKA